MIRLARACWRPLRAQWLVSSAAVVVAMALLSACSADGGPLVGPGERVVDDSHVRWVGRLTWSPDSTALAFLGAPIAGVLGAYRAALGDDDLGATPVGPFVGAGEVRFFPGSTDLVIVGQPVPTPAGSCGPAGVTLVRDAVAQVVVACPYDDPFGAVGRAEYGMVDPDHFVAVHPSGAVLVAPSGGHAIEIDLATLASRDLGVGHPLVFDPAGERLVVVEPPTTSDWSRQRWVVVDRSDGTREALPVAEDRFARGYHVLGARWLADGLVLLVERDQADGAQWLLWNLDTDEERSLGPAGGLSGDLPRWSASGRHVAFREYECVRESLIIGCAVGRWSVVVLDVATGDRFLAYRGSGFIEAPAVAPDGSAVAFAIDGVIYRKPLP
jgi:hypothetical protein